MNRKNKKKFLKTEFEQTFNILGVEKMFRLNTVCFSMSIWPSRNYDRIVNNKPYKYNNIIENDLPHILFDQ